MENLNEKYSIAIVPSNEIVSLIKSYKDLLASNIGSYKSRNAMAHITVKEIFANEKELELTIKQLQRICNSFLPFSVRCTHFNSYTSNKTIFIEPDFDSKKSLIEVMKKIQKTTTIKSNHISSDPHISIGRGIQKFEEALAILSFPLDINFIVDSIVIRKFNPEIKQYEIYRTIPFLSLPNQEPQQMSLF